MDQRKPIKDIPAANPPSRPVKGGVLTEWRARMGYSMREASRQLGCSRVAWANWERNKAPRYIGLAMAALALGMGDYGGKPPAGDAQ